MIVFKRRLSKYLTKESRHALTVSSQRPFDAPKSLIDGHMPAHPGQHESKMREKSASAEDRHGDGFNAKMLNLAVIYICIYFLFNAIFMQPNCKKVQCNKKLTQIFKFYNAN